MNGMKQEKKNCQERRRKEEKKSCFKCIVLEEEREPVLFQGEIGLLFSREIHDIRGVLR